MDIVVKNLNKAYGAKVVLSDTSMTFPEGKRTVVMGDSGCGKTTLLRILMGLENPDSGQILGIPKHISAVFQEDRLFDEFNAAANITFVAPKGTTNEIILQHLEEVGLQDSLFQSINKMSGGMKRRVVIVRAMLAKKELLLLDEPLKGLDEQNRDRTAAYIKRHSEGITTIMVTHDADEIPLMDANLILMETQ